MPNKTITIEVDREEANVLLNALLRELSKLIELHDSTDATPYGQVAQKLYDRVVQDTRAANIGSH